MIYNHKKITSKLKKLKFITRKTMSRKNGAHIKDVKIAAHNPEKTGTAKRSRTRMTSKNHIPAEANIEIVYRLLKDKK